MIQQPGYFDPELTEEHKRLLDKLERAELLFWLDRSDRVIDAMKRNSTPGDQCTLMRCNHIQSYLRHRLIALPEGPVYE